MNKSISVVLIMFVFVSTFLTSCSYQEVTIYSPEYLPFSEIRKPLAMVRAADSTADVQSAGKIYYYEPYLLINELNKGIHFFDNTKPEDPKYLGMLEIGGNIDMAVRDGILYADNYIDLLAIDISGLPDLSKAVIVKRIEDALFYERPFFGGDVFDDSVYYEDIDESKGIVTGWKKRVETRVSTDSFAGLNSGFPGGMAMSEDSSGGIKAMQQTGQGGSMAKFTIYDTYLYTVVSESALQLFNIINAREPEKFSNISIGRDIETIFPYAEKKLLFLGAQNGMYIYSIEDPGNPIFISTFLHARSYDPVVASGDYAYVTLRAGDWINSQNVLEVIDISTINEPKLIQTISMNGPYGLGIFESKLFVCDGEAGLKLYDITSPSDPQYVAQIGNFLTYDVIPVSGDLIMVTGPKELRQYRLDGIALTELSVITIRK